MAECGRCALTRCCRAVVQPRFPLVPRRRRVDEFIEKHYVSRRSRHASCATATPICAKATRPTRCSPSCASGRGKLGSQGRTWPSTRRSPLAALNTRGILLITLRRRTPALLREMVLQPWGVAHRPPRCPTSALPDAQGRRPAGPATPYGAEPLRQLFIRELGHEQPTVLLTTDLRATLVALIIRYARRVPIENSLPTT